MDLEASFLHCLVVSDLLVYILTFIHVVVPARLHLPVLAFQSFLKFVLIVSELGLEIVTKSNLRLTLLIVLTDIKERSNY